MKCVVIILSALMGVRLSEAKWCVQNTTTYIEVAKIFSRTIMVKTSWFQPPQPKSETYKQIERIPKTKQERVCCEGYVLDNVVRTCIATCPEGCPKLAECVEPNKCKCHEGYHLLDGICRLDCGNCENGRCTDLSTCECNPKYVRVEGACKAICRDKCTNGFCAAPDRCECNSGYQANLETKRCEPICSQTCGGNAYCSAPEVCTCKFGFFGNASDVCQPWCKSECKNGQCVGPNNCACHQGFAKVDGLCMPDCHSGCKFGDCLDEGVCQCWPDYVYNSLTGSCQEMLNVDLTTSTHSTQTSTRKSFQGDSTTTTTPVHTSSTTQTSTRRSFQAETTTAGLRLLGYGFSGCREGLVKVDETCICQSCQVGDCVEEHICQHSAKIKAISATESSSFSTSESSTSESSTSESSTSESSTTSNCHNCWTGTCIDNVCQCPDGLILNDENDCVFPCEATCKNGFCTNDHLCECRDGYVLKSGTECVPQCDKECVNSFCIAPNQCECLEGYIAQLNPSSAHACLPTCDGVDGEEGCINGTCVAVNKCQCLEGYVHKPGNRFECVPLITTVAEKVHYWYLLYLLLGILILAIMALLGLYALRKIHRNSYNVDKREKHRGTVRYMNDDRPYCVI